MTLQKRSVTAHLGVVILGSVMILSSAGTTCDASGDERSPDLSQASLLRDGIYVVLRAGTSPDGTEARHAPGTATVYENPFHGDKPEAVGELLMLPVAPGIPVAPGDSCRLIQYDCGHMRVEIVLDSARASTLDSLSASGPDRLLAVVLGGEVAWVQTAKSMSWGEHPRIRCHPEASCRKIMEYLAGNGPE
jgi:hypothetical protein